MSPSWAGAARWLVRDVRSCCHCGSWFLRNDWLCELCWESLLKQRLEPAWYWLPRLDFPALSLWSRQTDENPPLNSVVLSLKGGVYATDVVHMLARYLLRARALVSPGLSSPTVFVPAPAKVKGTQDHAGQLARALAHESQGLVWNHMQRRDGQAQKLSNRRDRWRLEVDMEPVSFPKSALCILVDDVITTGATVRAMRKVLPRGLPRVEAWSLMRVKHRS